MTFPTIPTSAAGRIISAVQANQTSTRTFPAFSGLTYANGDLLLAIVASYGTNASGNWDTWSNGFTEIGDLGASGVMPFGVAWKIASGTESGSLTVHEANTISGHAEMILMAIPGAHLTSAPEVGASNAGTGTAQTPPTLTPSWGALDTLWIAVGGNGATSSTGTFTGVTAAAANYGNFYDVGASAGTPATGVIDLAVAFRQLNAASEASGAFTVDVTNARNSAFMIAVKPLGGATGGASPSLTITPTATGKLGRSSGATPSLTIGVTASGTKGKAGTASPSLTINRTAAANLGLVGSATPSLTIGVTAAGARGKVADATQTLSIGVTASGVVSSGPTGNVSTSLTVNRTAAGSLGRSSGATPSLTISAIAAALLGVSGNVSKALSIGVTASGTVVSAAGSGDVSTTLTISVTAAANLGLKGGATKTLSIGVTASGLITDFVFLDITETSSVVVTPVNNPLFSLDISVPTYSDFRVQSPITLNPITGVQEYRVLLVDKDGNQSGEVETARLGPVKWAINALGSFYFSVNTEDPKIQQLNVPEQEVQVWRGGRLLWWGVAYRARADVNEVQFQCNTLEWYFNRRVMGPIPRLGHFRYTHFSAGAFAWSKGHMPGTTPALPPDYEISNQVTIAGDSLKMTSSGNLTVHTKPVTQIFGSSTSSTITNASKTILKSYVPDLLGTKPRVCVQVHSGGDSLSDDDADQVTQNQADAIKDFLEAQKDGIQVDAVGMGNQEHIAVTNTTAGLNAIRRVVITYLSQEGAHGEFFSQSFLYRVPAHHRHRVKVTMRGWMYVDSYLGPAMHQWAMVLERQNPRQLSLDPAYADRGHNRVVARSVVGINQDTVRRRWIRVEASLRIPNDGKWWKIEGRLHPCSGTVFWDEVDVLTDDALDFVNVEQGNIIKALVNHAQDPDMGKPDLNIGTKIAATGVKRTRRYLFSERTVIGDHLNEFSTFGDGMEWDIQITPTRRTFTTYFPRKARKVNYPLVLGRNVLDGNTDVDGSQTSSAVAVMMNINDASAREERSVVDSSLLNGLILETAYLATPGSSLSSLTKQAQRGMERYRKPVYTPTLTIRGDHCDEALRHLFPGAIIPVDVRAGWFEVIADHRITDMSLDPSTDQITLSLVPEDTPIKVLSNYGSEWKYTHAALPSGGGGFPYHPEYAARTFDDSAWSVGRGGFGWNDAGDGSIDFDFVPKTAITETHKQLWMRKVVPCTEEMYLNIRSDHWAWVYVNGTLVGPQYGRNYGNLMAPKPIRVPAELLDPSGQQVVMVNAQAQNPGGTIPWSLYCDVRVRGIFNPDHVVA